MIIVSVILSQPQLGELASFTTKINSDTSFMTPDFQKNGETFFGNGKLTDKLTILLSDGCMFGIDNIVTARFEQQ